MTPRLGGARRPDLAGSLAGLPRGRAEPAWPGRESMAGHGVMNLPLSSGHQLGLRVFPRSPTGGYTSVWHRTPDGAWRQYVDGAPVAAGCPRYWGPALAEARPARIDVTWTDPASLRVIMDAPALTWDLTLGQTRPLALLNAVNDALPTATWRWRPLVTAREWMARALGLGAVSMWGRLPTGGHLVAALGRLYWITASRARLDGQDLGWPTVLPACPTIGGWPLPRRGVYVVGAAHATVPDTGPSPPAG